MLPGDFEGSDAPPQNGGTGEDRSGGNETQYRIISNFRAISISQIAVWPRIRYITKSLVPRPLPENGCHRS